MQQGLARVATVVRVVRVHSEVQRAAEQAETAPVQMFLVFSPSIHFVFS
jgi:hypothetical protein